MGLEGADDDALASQDGVWVLIRVPAGQLDLEANDVASPARVRGAIAPLVGAKPPEREFALVRLRRNSSQLRVRGKVKARDDASSHALLTAQIGQHPAGSVFDGVAERLGRHPGSQVDRQRALPAAAPPPGSCHR